MKPDSNSNPIILKVLMLYELATGLILISYNFKIDFKALAYILDKNIDQAVRNRYVKF